MKELLKKRNFPIIKTIDDMKDENGKYPWENFKEIRIMRRNYETNLFDIIHYIVAFDEMWGSTINRECRGIMFDEEGKIVSRPFHKFFNVNERDETHERNLFNRKFYTSEKIDGALIIPEYIDNEVVFRTKKSFESDEALLVYDYLNLFDKKDIDEFFEQIVKWKEKGFTPLFEFVWSEKYPHIVKYKEPKLYFLALRDNINGKYYHPSIDINNDIFKTVYNLEDKYTLDELKELLKRKNKNFEGFNIVDDFDFYKLKTEWYLKLHKIKDTITMKNIIELVLKEEIDDLKSLLLSEGQTDVYEYVLKLENKFRKYYENILKEAENLYKKIFTENRKEFFIRLNKTLKNKNVKENLLRYYIISWYTGKQDKEEEIRRWKKYVVSLDI